MKLFFFCPLRGMSLTVAQHRSFASWPIIDHSYDAGESRVLFLHLFGSLLVSDMLCSQWSWEREEQV